MRLRFLAAAVVAVVTLSLLPAAALAAPVAANGSTSGPPYYLALGDSLAQGVQPTPSGTSRLTNQGYVDDLYAVYRRQVPNLRLVKLGCPGETTGTMINGGVCSYSRPVASSQRW